MRTLVIIALAVAGAPGAQALPAQSATRAVPRPAYPARAIRHDIPLTDMIQRAFAAGTRDTLGVPGPHYWQLWTDYTIAARLDPATGLLSGHEHVVVQNTSDSAMSEVVLRLDQNIFKGNVPKAEVMPSLTDGIVLTGLSFNGEPVNLSPPPLRFIRRGPTLSASQVTLAIYDTSVTSAVITLPTPVPAHGSFALDADWHFTVPKVVAPTRGLRMGAWGDSLYQVAQWYPRVAVFDDLRGWDRDPYLGPSEFYNNFGHFDVTLRLPAGWLVGASGVLQNPDQVLSGLERDRLSHVLESDSTLSIVGPDDLGPGKATAAGDTLTWHFVADTAGDVAWATSNRYLWEATRAAIPGKGEIPVNIMYLQGDSARFRDAGPTLRHALEFYSKLWIPYSFPVLSMADGPELGMEYPMFIMSSTGAADHETGHQWWPMTLGTNETWYGFMDEGFNQYMNILSRDDRDTMPAQLDGWGQSYGRVSGDEHEAPLMWDANYGGPMYSYQAYGKAPPMLSMLGGVVGDTAVWRAMRGYAQAWRFKHPSPWDYAFFMEHALHRDLGWFWYSWVFTTDAVNGSIQDVRTVAGRTAVTVRQDGQMPSPVVLAVHFAPKGPRVAKVRNAVMVDDTTAVVTYPVDVWFTGSRTFTAHLDFGRRKIERIVLDPHCRFPDKDVTDNVWPRQPPPAAPAGNGFGGGGRFRGPVCQG